MTLVVQVARKDLRILVDAAILHDRGRVVQQLAMMAQPPAQEEDLRMELQCRMSP